MILKSMLNIKTSFPERYIILKFMCRRLVSFIIILGNGKLLNSISDTFVKIVFTRLLSHHIKKGREVNSVDPKNFRLLTAQKHSSSLLKCKKYVAFPIFKPKR